MIETIKAYFRYKNRRKTGMTKTDALSLLKTDGVEEDTLLFISKHVPEDSVKSKVSRNVLLAIALHLPVSCWVLYSSYLSESSIYYYRDYKWLLGGAHFLLVIAESMVLWSVGTIGFSFLALDMLFRLNSTVERGEAVLGVVIYGLSLGILYLLYEKNKNLIREADSALAEKRCAVKKMVT